MTRLGSLNRFFVDPSAILSGRVVFPLELSRQIHKVLRLDVQADQVLVLDNSGKSHLVQLAGWQGKTLTGKILETYLPEQEERLELELAFSLTKREKITWILQKGTELGVTRFRPYVAARSLDHTLTPEPSRMLRWQAIIREAAEQSRRERLAEIEAPSTFADMLKVVPQVGLKLIAWEEANPKEQLSASFLAQITAEPVRLVSALIGPEGGFSPEEVALAESFGFIQFSLGRRTLRMETACLAACALLTNLLENQA